MDDKTESCCTIDYLHHKAIFEQRRQAFFENPAKAVTTHQARIRLIQDHYKEAKVPVAMPLPATSPQKEAERVRGQRRCSIWSPPSGFDC